MGKRLTKAPVYYMLAQVRFNPIWKLADYSATIQEAFRKLGYSDARFEALSKVNLADITDAQPGVKVPVEQALRYSYTNAERDFGFIVQADSVTCHTTSYETFPSFLRRFGDALGVLHSVLDLDYSERIGVRYLDAIIPTENKNAASYLRPEMRGLREQFDGVPLHTFSENVFRVDECMVVSRAIILSGSIGFPPDLIPGPLRLADRFAGYAGEHCTLDTDCFLESRRKFDVDGLLVSLQAIQDQASAVFKAVVTREALAEWR